jgi:hypothetical protein
MLVISHQVPEPPIPPKPIPYPPPAPEPPIPKPVVSAPLPQFSAASCRSLVAREHLSPGCRLSKRRR